MASVAAPHEQTEVPVAPVYRFTVAQYHRMTEAGVLTEDDRVELLEGWIVHKMPHNPPHDATITRIQRRLTRILPDEWLLRIQCAITTPDSEPEPDLAVVQGPEEVYFARHPGPGDIALLIEVADTTIEQDRGEKRRLYARARIAAYWIVNLPESKIEVYTSPRAGKSPAYRQQQDYGLADSLPLSVAGRVLAHLPVAELLPPSA
jgi:hypothetical protein